MAGLFANDFLIVSLEGLGGAVGLKWVLSHGNKDLFTHIQG